MTSPNTDPSPNTERIRIRSPLSLSTAGALLTAVGTLWPDTVIESTTGNELCLRVPRHAPKRLTKKTAREIAARHQAEREEEGADAQVLGFSDGTLHTTVPEEARVLLAECAYTFLTGTEGAINYCEFEVTHADHQWPLVISAAWSTGQTPHALRLQAERRYADLARKVRETGQAHLLDEDER